MKKPKWGEDYQTLQRQANSLYSLCVSQEQQLTYQSKIIKDLKNKLALIDQKEIDSLHELIERLTDRIEELENAEF